MKKKCGHQGMREDPHPYCRRCAEKHAGFICDGFTIVCDTCEATPAVIWDTINRAASRNVRKRKQGPVGLNVSKSSATSGLEIDDAMANIDYSSAKPKRYKSALLWFPEDLSELEDATQALSGETQVDQSSQISLEEANRLLSQKSDDSLISPGQGHQTSGHTDGPALLDPATAAAWTTYTKSPGFIRWYQEQMGMAPNSMAPTPQKPSATLSKPPAETAAAEQAASPARQHEEINLSSTNLSAVDPNFDNGSDDHNMSSGNDDADIEHDKESDVLSAHSDAESVAESHAEKTTEKSVEEIAASKRAASPEHNTAPNSQAKKTALPPKPRNKQILEAAKAAKKRKRSPSPDLLFTHSTPQRSPFKFAGCGDKVRSPRRVAKRRRLFRRTYPSDDEEYDTPASQSSWRESNPDPLEAPIKHILPTIARWSEAELGPPHDICDSTNFRLESEGQDYNPNNFIALSTASGVVKAVRAKMQEFRARDVTANRAITFGRPFTTSKMKVSRHMYKGSDANLPLNPMTCTPNAPVWLRQARPDDKVTLKERDIIYWEGQARSALRILSLVELINQTQRNGMSRLSPPEVEDLLSTNIKAIKDLIKLSTEWLTHCVQIRRDGVLQRCELTADQLFDLRHAPVVDEACLFPEQLVREIHGKHLQELQNQALRARYAAPPRTNYGGGGAFQRSDNRGNYNNKDGNQQKGRQLEPKPQPKAPQGRNRVFHKANNNSKNR